MVSADDANLKVSVNSGHPVAIVKVAPVWVAKKYGFSGCDKTIVFCKQWSPSVAVRCSLI